MEAKVSIWFGNNLKNRNRFHLIWKHISKMEMVSIIWIQFPLDLETFIGYWYLNQTETVSILKVCFQISWILVAITDTSCGYLNAQQYPF